MKETAIIVLVILLLSFEGEQAYGQASIVRKPITELLEYFAKKGGNDGLKEMSEIGGEQAVREILERATAQGGDDLARQVVTLTRQHGTRTLEAVGADPAVMVKALKAVPEERLLSAITEASRNPDLMARLVRAHGDEVLVVSSRHPGVGSRIIDEFGVGGLKAAKELTTDEVIVLGRTRGFGDLPTATKDMLSRLLDRNPREFVNALVAVGGGAALYLTLDKANRIADIMIGTKENPGPAIRPLITYSWIVGGCLVAILLGYAGIKLWGVWQITRKIAKE